MAVARRRSVSITPVASLTSYVTGGPSCGISITVLKSSGGAMPGLISRTFMMASPGKWTGVNNRQTLGRRSAAPPSSANHRGSHAGAGAGRQRLAVGGRAVISRLWRRRRSRLVHRNLPGIGLLRRRPGGAVRAGRKRLLRLRLWFFRLVCRLILQPGFRLTGIVQQRTPAKLDIQYLVHAANAGKLPGNAGRVIPPVFAFGVELDAVTGIELQKLVAVKLKTCTIDRRNSGCQNTRLAFECQRDNDLGHVRSSLLICGRSFLCLRTWGYGALARQYAKTGVLWPANLSSIARMNVFPYNWLV